MCLFFLFFFVFCLFSCVRLLVLTTEREVRGIPKSKEHSRPSRPSRSKGVVRVRLENQSTRQNPSRIAYNEQIALDDRMFILPSRRASGAEKQGDKTVLQGCKPCKLKNQWESSCNFACKYGAMTDDGQQKQCKSQTPQNPSGIAYSKRITSDDRMFIPVSKRVSDVKKQRGMCIWRYFLDH